MVSTLKVVDFLILVLSSNLRIYKLHRIAIPQVPNFESLFDCDDLRNNIIITSYEVFIAIIYVDKNANA